MMRAIHRLHNENNGTDGRYVLESPRWCADMPRPAAGQLA